MKYLSQFLIILGFTFLGEALQRLVPAPIPASVWGLVLLFGALCLKLIRVEQVKDAGGFLTSFLPVLFVAPIVSLLDCWDQIRPYLLPILAILIGSTVLTFGIAGKVTGFFLKKGGESHE